MTTYHIAQHNGKIHIRESSNRVYTHAVITETNNRYSEGRSSSATFSSRKELAEKEASALRSMYSNLHYKGREAVVTVVEVEQVSKEYFGQIKRAAAKASKEGK